MSTINERIKEKRTALESDVNIIGEHHPASPDFHEFSETDYNLLRDTAESLGISFSIDATKELIPQNAYKSLADAINAALEKSKEIGKSVKIS